MPLGSSLNVQLMSDSGTEETIYNESLELEEEHILVPSFSDWFSAPKFPYHLHVAEQISQMRLQFGGQIFFDRLLEVIGVSAALYPPRTTGQWKILFGAIFEASDVDNLRKHCLVYFSIFLLNRFTIY